MRVVNVLSVTLLLFVVSFGQNISVQKENDANKYIGKTFTLTKDLDPSLSEGAGMSIGDYVIKIYGKKPWTASSNVKLVNTLVFFEKITGYSGNKSIHKVIDVLSIDLKNYKPGSEVRLNECTASGKGDDYFTVAVYQLEAASKTKNGLKPQKAWHPDIKTGKFVEISPDSLLCQTVNEEE